MKKGGLGANKKKASSKPKAKFRVMHDRFTDDPEMMLDLNAPVGGDRNSGISASNKNLGMKSYMEGGAMSSTHMGKDKSDGNIFSGNKKLYNGAGKSTTNLDKSYVP